ncbi:MAG: hypothetical protein ACE5LU_06400 [Anaerolineae bacterium]
MTTFRDPVGSPDAQSPSRLCSFVPLFLHVKTLLLLGFLLLLSLSLSIAAGDAAAPNPTKEPPALVTPTGVAPAGFYPTPPPLPFPPPTPPGYVSSGFNTRIQLPAIDHGDEWETWIQVQNVGLSETKAIGFLWGDYTGACPPQAPGPLTVVCTGLLHPGAAWAWMTYQLTPAARSGIVYSVPASIADEACELAFRTRGSHFAWLRWEREFAGQGEPIAVTVNRIGPGGEEGIQVASSYTGISETMEGVNDPLFGGFTYYAPLLYNEYHDLDSELIIQNSGNECSSVEIWYKEQADCLRSTVRTIGGIAPGESLRIAPDGLPISSQGSAWIRASQPLGIVVDHRGRGLLMSYRAVPADSAGADFTAGAFINYAPLIYREFNGWDTGIQVQNLSSTHNAKVKVTFLDNSGNTMATVADWVCPRGSQTYFLPAINQLPGRYVGAAVITSQGWFSPGAPAVDAARVSSVVNLINYGTGQALSYNALTPQETQGIGAVGIPLLLQNRRGITSQVAIQNLNPNPGSTTFRLSIHSPNGLIDGFCFTLGRGQIIYFDLADIRILNPGFRGSAVITVTSSSQRGAPAIGAVMVERGTWPGDQSKATEGFPIPMPAPPPLPIGCP